jgi:SAM-dependent methyltransferase
MTTPDFKEIAAQLRNPQGENGIKTAQRMSENNNNMIKRCIDHLPLKEGDRVLEVGPGGGSHLPYLISKAGNLDYQGLDISETMVHMATEENRELVTSGKVTFQQVPIKDGYVTIPFADNSFDSIFTVNTIYFWDNAAAQAKELRRVLKPEGTLSVCFATADFMSTLPFTQYGFDLYDTGKAEKLFTDAGFTACHPVHEKEEIMSNTGESVERDFVILNMTGKSVQ